jgi:hypothetical protein
MEAEWSTGVARHTSHGNPAVLVEDCMKITRHKTASMFKPYADLFSDEVQRAQQRAVPNRTRECKKAHAATVVTIPTRTAVQ